MSLQEDPKVDFLFPSNPPEWHLDVRQPSLFFPPSFAESGEPEFPAVDLQKGDSFNETHQKVHQSQRSRRTTEAMGVKLPHHARMFQLAWENNDGW